MTAATPDTVTTAAVLLATGLPFAAFALIMAALRGRPRLCAGLSIAAITVSLSAALLLLVRHWHMTAPIGTAAQWLVSGRITVSIGFLLDPTSLLMLTIVTAISFLVQVYSLGYMAGEPGFARYYGCMSLFAWAMTSLVVSPTMLQLYVFWELVGVASYLLIGFWYEKFSASEAGKKAFVMTRTGDVAFFLGLLLVLVHFGNLDILKMNAGDVPLHMPPAMITLSALLIFGGIVGKSAQFPLLTWLPDAMEGPTPVSALLHSATMVAAGVYLFARLFPFFRLSPTAMTVFLAIGTVSMLLASTMAMVTRDIKQVWAYSTISQLGFMIMGLAASGYVAGVFHLTTHAGFKALLFLCAGVFIHAFGTNDMFAIGRAGGRALKIPMICMTIGAAALAGLPPLSGFFSKEAIMGRLAGLSNPLWLGAGLLGAFLTAYYTFRLIFAVAVPAPEESGDETPVGASHGGHGGDPHHARHYHLMAASLVVLAGVTLALGWAHGALGRFLTAVDPGLAAHTAAHLAWLPYVAIGLALAGVLLAWVEFGRTASARIGFVERVEPVARLFARRWYIDDFYRWFLDRVVYTRLSAFCDQGDRRVIDGGLDAVARGTVGGSRRLSVLHLSMVQYKMMVIFAVMGLLTLYFFLG